MGLEDDVNVAESALACGGQSGSDFGGMVSIIVDDAHACGFAFELEAAIDTTKTVEAGTDLVRGDVERGANGDGRGGVEHIMLSGHAQGEFAEIFFFPIFLFICNPKTAEWRLIARAMGLLKLYQEIGSFAGSVGRHAAMHARKQAFENGIVVAAYDQAVEGHAFHKFKEGAVHVAHIAIAVHVLAVNVGDDRDNRRKLQKGAVALVRLRDQVLRFAEASI